METKTIRFAVGEIEHDSDLNDAVARIRAAGAIRVDTVQVDFDSERALFDAVVPVDKVEHFRRVRQETEFV